jgi:predicted metal-dependent hydrolase
VCRPPLSVAATLREREARSPEASSLAEYPCSVSYERGLELIRAGRYFEAHEELEDAWRAAEPGERDFLQGLVHVAVAWYQAGRGRRIGCERQLEKAARRLSPYTPAHRGLDVTSLLDSVAKAQSTAAGGNLELTPPCLWRQ